MSPNASRCSIASSRSSNSLGVTGTPVSFNTWKKLTSTELAGLAPMHEGQSLQQLHILLVFQQCSV